MKSTILAFIIFSLSVLHLAGQDLSPLFVVTVNGQQGFIDRNGKVVIEPKFLQCSTMTKFVDRLAVVCTKDNDRAGFIDRTGRFVIPQAYDEARNFSEGLAAVQFGQRGLHDQGDYHTGFVDKTGKLVIEPIFKEAADFSEGLSAVRKGGKSGFIDKSGKVVIPLQFDYAFSFSEGLAAVFVNGQYGFIDKTGALVIKPQYTYTRKFSEGLALVRVNGGTVLPYPNTAHIETMSLAKPNFKYAYIDRRGKVIFEIAADDAGSFSDGLAVVFNGKEYGLVNKKGKFSPKPNLLGAFGRIPHFSEMLALTFLKQEGLGFVDKKGKVVISTKYEYAFDFENGLAQVCINVIDTCGYINKTGKVIWKPTK